MKYTPEELRREADAREAYEKGKPIEEMHPEYTHGQWRAVLSDGCAFALDIGWQHRPKPEPKTRPWSKPEDVPPLCWIYFNKPPENALGVLVVAVVRTGIVAMEDATGAGVTFEVNKWADLGNCHYSTDRKTWHPCTVTEA